VRVAGAETPVLIHLLRIVPGTGEIISEGRVAVAGAARHFDWNTLAFAGYGLVAAGFLGLFAYHLFALVRLRRSAAATQLDAITLIPTDAPGTPFSFFRWIFWDQALPVDSENGQAIFRHELAHVRGRHSLDKTMLQLLCAVLFPVYPLYLIRRELQLVHEYEADRAAAGKRDTDAYARFLLEHALMGRSYGLSNAFYQHPLAKRIAMIQRSMFTPAKFQAWRRWLVLPLFAGAAGLFAFTLESRVPPPPPSVRTLTVVIDAGHGGSDAGCYVNGIREKDINLAIAKDVERLAPGYSVNVLLSRNADSLVQVRDRVAFAAASHADLFVSIHTNVDPTSEHSGIQTYLSLRNAYRDSSALLGSLVAEHLGAVYPTEQVLRHNTGPHVFVLDHNVCPAILVECGYLSNKKDAAFIINPVNQEKVAREILRSVADYARGAAAPVLPVKNR
jgi:N-acetylmuramoyl-L-alanine amidase